VAPTRIVRAQTQHEGDLTVHTRSLAVVAVAALALIPVACSDDTEPTAGATTTTAATSTAPTTTADGDLDAFCSAGGEIDAATSTIDSPDAAVTVFTDLQPTIDTMVAAAPAGVAGDARAFSDHVDGALSSKDFTAFEDGTVDSLVARFESACAGAEG